MSASPQRLLDRRAIRAALLVLVAPAPLAAPAHGQQPPSLTTFLRSEIGLLPAQVDAALSGDVVVKVLETSNTRDVAVFGMVAVDVPGATVVHGLGDVRSSLRTPTRVKLGVFGDVPSLGDVRDVTADDEAVAELRKCKPGSCNFKLPASDMARARSLVSSGGDPRSAVTAYVRQRMVEYATDYRARGNSALVVYDDRGGTRASDAFGELLASSPYLYRYVPRLHEYLRAYPAARPSGAMDALVWWQDEMPGLRPVLSITHLTLYQSPELSGVTVRSAKQLYANHYFEAAFELLTVIDRRASEALPGAYLLVVRRYRFDNLPSGGLLNIRGRVTEKLRDALRGELARTKQEVERAQARGGG